MGWETKGPDLDVYNEGVFGDGLLVHPSMDTAHSHSYIRELELDR